MFTKDELLELASQAGVSINFDRNPGFYSNDNTKIAGLGRSLFKANHFFKLYNTEYHYYDQVYSRVGLNGDESNYDDTYISDKINSIEVAV
ncbi:hypothetical protein [Leuconostoc suionicum]|uniref:hypothetical protein n=1 Tax=Leuconostoc suionicum TaxID=1511761 RepID=UPI001B8C0067|nr:hypothetical protein [Leuconostoc suionicum]MBS1007803.1 hypothetical protein [Leuconostoc suionicum]